MDFAVNQPRAAVIEDISGAGKCSLTVALPVLSVAGVSCSVLPTAVLSTHPGGYTGYTYRDLTEDLLPFASHWKKEGLHFDALYSGFLGSHAQLQIVKEIFTLFNDGNSFVLVDPVMGDHGKLYSLYSPDMVDGMRQLCGKASVITPNMTEAAFLAGVPYQDGPYTRPYIQGLLRQLAELGAAQVVLTGVYFDDSQIGAACYEKQTETFGVELTKRIPGYYHGTGDVFGAALLAGILQKLPLKEALRLAVEFVGRCAARTAKAGTPVREGLCFEPELAAFGEIIMKSH